MTNRNVCAAFSVFVFMAITAGIPAASQSFRVQCPTSTITHPPAPITSASLNKPSETVTIKSALVPSVGDSVIIAGVSQAGYDGIFTVTGLVPGGFTYKVPAGTSLNTANNSGTVTDNNSEPAYTGPTQFSAPTAGVPSGTSGDFFTPKAGTVNGAIKCQQVSGGDGLSTMGDGNQIFMFGFGPLSGLADVAAGHPGTQFPQVFNTPYSAVSSVPLVRGDPATTDGATSRRRAMDDVDPTGASPRRLRGTARLA